jgi:WD40 repeat protein
MGCSNGRTIEGNNSPNKGYPECRLTVPLTKDVDSMIAINDNKLVLGAKNELQLFESESKAITLISNEHKGRINCLVKLSNGKVVSGSQDTTIKEWDIDKKESICTLKGHTSIIWDIRELEGNKIISASDDNTSKVWDLNSKKELFNLCTSHRHISSIALVNKKKVVLASGRNLLLYNLETKQQESCLDIAVWTLKELSNGDIACGLGNGLLYIIKVTDELIIKTKFAKGHKTSINCIIELENHKIVTSSDENDLIMWNPNDPESMYFIKGHTKLITSLCFISGTKFASASRDKTLKIWE